MKIIEQSQVSPPPASVPTTSLPLTFFDYPWLFCVPIQRLFFFRLSHPFTHTTLSALKSSLSRTLRFFFPLAAKLSIPPPPLKPHMTYTDGDSVHFTVAESSADFDRVTDPHPMSCEEIYHLIPELPPAQEAGDGTRVVSLLAVQVTLFPNSGICIAITFNHVVGDGRSINHFMKSWASVFRGDLVILERFPPFCDRDAIRRSEFTGYETNLLKDSWHWGLNPITNHTYRDFYGKVRVSLVIGEADIKKLKHWLSSQYSVDLRISGFVSISALVWKCLMKSQENRYEKKELSYFALLADCSSYSELAIPANYFGNCLAVSMPSLKRSDLLGEKGLALAARAIGEEVKALGKDALKEAGSWVRKWKEGLSDGEVVSIAGSPRLRAYETDFGWGKPTRTEVAHIYPGGSVYLGDAKDEKGGWEIGLALEPTELDAFRACFEEALRAAV